MKPFNYTRAATPGQAVKSIAGKPEGRFLAGGTNLLDLMKEHVETATDIIDLTRLDLAEIKETDDGGLRLGALAKNSDTANHKSIRENYPLLSRAILAGATFQIRNMATNGGNPLQRTRCQYFYDTATPCNKRAPGSGCGAMEGLNRNHAIFGWSDKCIATHPSDMAVALAALEAVVQVQGPDGERSIPFADFHRLPGDKPEQDTNLKPGELIVAIDLPPAKFQKHYYYLKVRDRASYAFALVSVAVAIELDGDTIKDIRIAMGGVAHKPWRAAKAEEILKGKAATVENFEKAADAEMADAKPLEHNQYKVPLGRNGIVRALRKAANLA